VRKHLFFRLLKYTMSHLIPEQSPQARILDPRAGVIVAHDSHLPAIAADRLSRDTIAAALQRWDHAPPISAGDGNRFANRSIRQAAVLIGLIERGSGLNVVLTQRASHLRDHAGQISFPGGAADAADVDTWHTAQREALEEIDLQGQHLSCLGRTHPYTTVTAFVVTPWVAWIDPKAQFKPALDEVAQVFEVPLTHLMNPANHQQRSVMTPVGERRFYAIPSLDAQGEARFVWGATAGMLRNLYSALSAA
jgi:8-oxo-dGTP pyrophosphatase MutT (NUDIX family)